MDSRQPGERHNFRRDKNSCEAKRISKGLGMLAFQSPFYTFGFIGRQETSENMRSMVELRLLRSQESVLSKSFLLVIRQEPNGGLYSYA